VERPYSKRHPALEPKVRSAIPPSWNKFLVVGLATIAVAMALLLWVRWRGWHG
jgi:hypothetical protein